MGRLPLAQNYAMNVAETASTFAEMILADAAVKNAANDEERLVLLEDKLQSVVAFFMNIHARFLFEKNFYEQRKRSGERSRAGPHHGRGAKDGVQRRPRGVRAALLGVQVAFLHHELSVLPTSRTLSATCSA